MNMNLDEYELFRNLKKEQVGNVALDFIKSLDDRRYGHFKKNKKSQESRELFAEEEFLRKENHNSLRCEMPGLPRSTFLMVFSPDGTKVASTHGNHNIYVTDIRTGKNLKTLVGHPRTPWCIAFHPSSNQIIASGCLGGQVRIWDLSGGSEVWTAENQTVIASIAFHPNDRMLVVATFNEIHFWDWSEPKPFYHCATANQKEKVRYVAFDKLGNKLVTGITNNPQSRWERVRVPVPTSRPVERSASPYRRRIIPSLYNVSPVFPAVPQSSVPSRERLSSVPERERNITICYRNLVREYGRLVQRYLQLYRPPVMIDRGTDPMESPSEASTSREPQPSTSGAASPPTTEDVGSQTVGEHIPSSTGTEEPNRENTPDESSSSTILPSYPSTSSQQHPETSSSSEPSTSRSSESRKHKANEEDLNTKKKIRKSDTDGDNQPGPSRVVANDASSASENDAPSSSNNHNNEPSSSSNPESDRFSSARTCGRVARSTRRFASHVGTNLNGTSKIFRVLGKKRLPTSPVVYRKFSRKVPSCPMRIPADDERASTSQSDAVASGEAPRDTSREARRRVGVERAAVIFHENERNSRSQDSNRDSNRSRFRRCSVTFSKKPNRRPVLDTSSDNSSDEDREQSTPPVAGRITRRRSEPLISPTGEHIPVNPSDVSENAETPDSMNLRNFNTELENLVTNLLLELERTQPVNRRPAHQSVEANLSNSRSSTSNANHQNPSSTPNGSCSRVQSLQRNCANVLAETYRRSAPSTPAPPTTPGSVPSNSGASVSPSIRRRFGAHRASTFMTTRANYRRALQRLGRNPTSIRVRASFPFSSLINNSLFNQNNSASDEVINYSERVNEDDLPIPMQFHPFDPPPDVQAINPENIGIGSMYSNIVQDLESSLNDVRNIRATNRPGEMSGMLSTYSQRLENIMNQSETILWNLRNSMDVLGPSSSRPSENTSTPNVMYNDQNFFVRDHRETTRSGGANGPNEGAAASNLSVNADHTYPRNIQNNGGGNNDNMSPLMSSLHLTISHIQRQARLLRQQVESIERIDRAMVEVAQLQLIRLLLGELSRYVRNLAGESRSTCMSSVRQMMAGTRISDSSPADSPAEDNQDRSETAQPQTSTSSNNTSSDQSSAPNTRTFRSRRSHFPLRRQMRRTLVYCFSRRYMLRPDRFNRMGTQLRRSIIGNYGRINTFTLGRMSRSLEELIHEQVRSYNQPLFARSAPPPPPPPSSDSRESEEEQLAARLQECIQRTNRLVGNILSANTLRNYRAETSCVARDGAGRYAARQTLGFIIDGLSQHLEDSRGATIPPSTRSQIQAVMSMSLLLSELLLLQIIDSIPPPTGMNLEQERSSLVNRVEQMCSVMLSSRYSGYSQHLIHSLRYLRPTMLTLATNITRSFAARRTTMMNPRDLVRSQLLGTLNRSLRLLNRSLFTSSSYRVDSSNRWFEEYNDDVDNGPSSSSPLSPSVPTEAANAPILEDDPDDDGADDIQRNATNNPLWSQSSTGSIPMSRLTLNYNASSAVLHQPAGEVGPGASSSRAMPWSVPLVQVNDVPVVEAPEGGGGPRRAYPVPNPFVDMVVNPFDADLDDPQREQVYDSDMVTTVTPNHRIQVWDISNFVLPSISNPLKNVVVNECKIHNDASVDIAKDGSILVTLLPSGGYLNVTNRLGVYSLRWETLGQCLYTTNFDHNAVSVSLSPLGRHLVVGLASRRASLIPTNRWTMARVFKIDQVDIPGDRLPMVRELEQYRDARATSHKSVNCIRWLPVSGQGFIYATNTGQLVILT